MAEIGQIRGALLEESVSHLLHLAGYRIATEADPWTERGKSGLEVQGRGCRHQIDTVACYDSTPAFMYPLRLLVEAKCYTNTVGLAVVRSTVGVLKDISENYFTVDQGLGADGLKLQRFNYHGAIFSASGFSDVAQKYAIAHQVFLIDYDGVHSMKPVVDAIRDLKKSHFTVRERNSLNKLREWFREEICSEGEGATVELSQRATEKLAQVVAALRNVGGSYIGMLQGRWPLHLVASRSLPEGPFRGTDEVRCKVYGYDSDTWSFSPVGVGESDPSFFRLDFRLPTQIAAAVSEVRDSPVGVADLKEECSV